MRKNGIRELWANNKCVVNSWLAIPNSFSAEIIASIGFDSVTIDMQHGMVNFQKAVEMLQAISIFNTTPLIRVPWNDPAIIMKSLDAGSYGIICPMINTKDECHQFVSACRYAPRGMRSFGPARAKIYAGDDYGQNANDNIITFAMIETAMAVENLSDILSVEELDAVYIGPSDLALTMGHMPSINPVDEVNDAISYILEESKKSNIKTGIHCPNGKTVKNRLDMGFNFATIANDVAFITQSGSLELDNARGENK